jgi:hypothetical protein
MLKQVFENPTLLGNAPCRSIVTSVRKGGIGVRYPPAVRSRRV